VIALRLPARGRPTEGYLRIRIEGRQGVDVRDAASVESLMADIGKSFSDPAILVNNAGVTRDNCMHEGGMDDCRPISSVFR
jgi:NADP-dependent 3-hydroxy acid dehydrogenase YdfG